MLRLLRRPAIAGHVPEIDGVPVGQGVDERPPEHRRPRRAVAEHHWRTVAGTAPCDLPPLPLVAFGQIHVPLVPRSRSAGPVRTSASPARWVIERGRVASRRIVI